MIQRTVKSHIDNLERLVRQLNDELMQEKDLQRRNDLEAKIRAAEFALKHYQTALELEQTLSAHE